MSGDETITRAELAEALDSGQFGLESSFVGGRELAVNVFAYVRAKRSGGPVAPSPIAASPDTGRPAASGPEKARAGSAPSSPDVLARTVSPFTLAQRLEAAETRLAALRSVLLEGGQDAETARKRALGIILGSDKEASRG